MTVQPGRLLTFREAAHTDGVGLEDKLKRMAIPACADAAVPAEMAPGTLFWSADSDLPRIKRSDDTFVTLAAGGAVPTLDPVTFFARPDSGSTPLTGITVPQAVDAIKGFSQCRTPENFGAVGDGSADDTVPLQNAINFCAANHMPLVLTNGATYRTTGMLQVGDGASYVSLKMHSQSSGFVGTAAAATIHATSKLLPALNIQGALCVELKGFVIKGDNIAPDGLAEPSRLASDYVSGGFSATRWAPHAGLTIDAFSGGDPGTGYPGKTYGQIASATGIVLESLVVSNFVVDFCNFGTVGNASNVRYSSCSAVSCQVGFANCQTQARAQTYFHISGYAFHTMFDGRSFGAQNGSAQAIFGGEIGPGYRVFNCSTTFDSLYVERLYAEAICSIGFVQGALPASLVACSFNMNAAFTDNPLVHGNFGCGSAKFIACNIETRQPFLNLLHSANNMHTQFEACRIQSPNPLTPADYQVCSRVQLGYNKVVSRECNISIANNTGVDTWNEEPDLTFNSKRVDIGQCTRRIRTYGTANLYIGDGDLTVIPGFADHAVGLAASGYGWVGSTLTFTAGVTGEFRINDLLYWLVRNTAAGGSPDAPVVTDHIQGSVIALQITNVVGTTITAVAQGNITDLDTTDNPATVYVVLRDWAPLTAVTATWPGGSTALTMSDASFPIQVGDFVRAGQGLPAIVRVAAVAGAAVTLSKNTTAPQASPTQIFCSRFSAADKQVSGPSSSTDNAITRWDATTGRLIQDSTVFVDDSGNITGVGTMATGLINGVSTAVHASRHNVGGADALFPGTWAAEDRATWTGSAWIAKQRSVCTNNSDQSSIGTSLTAVTNLTFTVKVGTYVFDFSGLYVPSSAIPGGGPKFDVLLTTAVASVWQANLQIQSLTGTFVASAPATPVSAGDAPPGLNDLPWRYTGNAIFTTGGTVQLRIAALSFGTLVVRAGAVGRLEQL